MVKKDEVLKSFSALKGIGKAKAELLYTNGYDSFEKLKKATVNDITNIKGFTEKNAQDLLDQLQEKPAKPTKKPPVKPVAMKKEPKKEKPKTEEKPEEQEEDVEIVEEQGDQYKVKKKPELDDARKKQLQIRKQIKQRTPEFLREEWFRYKRVGKNWRRPDGITSKMRKNLKYRPSRVRVGFRGPEEVRGLHSSGFEEVFVYNVDDLKEVNPKTQAARIGGTVGTRKRLEIVKKAEELEIRVLNMRV
jgi:large subunit ribosomal protein L32e